MVILIFHILGPDQPTTKISVQNYTNPSNEKILAQGMNKCFGSQIYVHSAGNISIVKRSIND